MQCYKRKSALFLALFVFLDSRIIVRAQLPSFLSALYGGGLSGTSTPSPRPKGPPPNQPRRTRFETYDLSAPTNYSRVSVVEAKFKDFKDFKALLS